MKLSMEYHHNYLEYMIQKHGWNVVSLYRYKKVTELFDDPMYLNLSLKKEVLQNN